MSARRRVRRLNPMRTPFPCVRPEPCSIRSEPCHGSREPSSSGKGERDEIVRRRNVWTRDRVEVPLSIARKLTGVLSATTTNVLPGNGLHSVDDRLGAAPAGAARGPPARYVTVRSLQSAHAYADQTSSGPDVRRIRSTPDDDPRPGPNRGIPAGHRRGRATRRHRSRRRRGQRHPEPVRGTGGCRTRHAVEQTTIAVLAQQLAAANGFADIVQVIQGDILETQPPERVDAIVSEWLGGFGIDEGMLVPVIAARDRWLKPGGTMIPRSVTAWAALVHDRYLADMVDFLRADPYGFKLDDLVATTVNEILYSGTFRHLAAGDRRSEPSRLWTTDTALVPLEQAMAPHQAETPLEVREPGTANALALWFSAEIAPGISLSVGPGDPPTHWGMTTAPLNSPVDLTPGMTVRARVRTSPALPVGTWTSWAIAMPGADWEEHDEQAVWEEIDDD